MKKIIFLSCILMTPLAVSAASTDVTSGENILSADTAPDTNTDAFIDKLNGLGKDQKIRNRLKDRHKKKKNQVTGSSYGRGSAGKVAGRVSANTVERPGASLGGNSGY